MKRRLTTENVVIAILGILALIGAGVAGAADAEDARRTAERWEEIRRSPEYMEMTK